MVCLRYRLATCAGRRRSSATARCPSAHIASTTRPTAYSHKWKRNGIRQKGMSRTIDDERARFACIALTLDIRIVPNTSRD